MTVFSRAHRTYQRARAEKNFKDFSFLQDWAENQISDRLQDIKRELKNIAVIGRISPSFIEILKKSVGANITQIHITNEHDEVSLEPQSQDAIISILDLHSLNDLPGILIQIRRSLKPDGFFIGCMAGGETLYELRDVFYQTEIAQSNGASPRIYPFIDKPEMGSLLQRAGFALPVVDSEILRVAYRDLFHVMRDLRGMGEGNIITARLKTFTPRRFFNNANTLYQKLYPDPQDPTRITASFEIIFLIGWAAHESQQKPLRPGSATARLADVLETKETKL